MFFWALHDANYNVIGLVNPFSVARPLVERYEYTCASPKRHPEAIELK